MGIAGALPPGQPAPARLSGGDSSAPADNDDDNDNDDDSAAPRTVDSRHPKYNDAWCDGTPCDVSDGDSTEEEHDRLLGGPRMHWTVKVLFLLVVAVAAFVATFVWAGGFDLLVDLVRRWADAAEQHPEGQSALFWAFIVAAIWLSLPYAPIMFLAGGVLTPASRAWAICFVGYLCGCMAQYGVVRLWIYDSRTTVSAQHVNKLCATGRPTRRTACSPPALEEGAVQSGLAPTSRSPLLLAGARQQSWSRDDQLTGRRATDAAASIPWRASARRAVRKTRRRLYNYLHETKAFAVLARLVSRGPVKHLCLIRFIPLPLWIRSGAPALLPAATPGLMLGTMLPHAVWVASVLVYTGRIARESADAINDSRAAAINDSRGGVVRTVFEWESLVIPAAGVLVWVWLARVAWEEYVKHEQELSRHCG